MFQNGTLCIKLEKKKGKNSPFTEFEHDRSRQKKYPFRIYHQNRYSLITPHDPCGRFFWHFHCFSRSSGLVLRRLPQCFITYILPRQSPIFLKKNKGMVTAGDSGRTDTKREEAPPISISIELDSCSSSNNKD
jgi:hypothetical protein